MNYIRYNHINQGYSSKRKSQLFSFFFGRERKKKIRISPVSPPPKNRASCIELTWPKYPSSWLGMMLEKFNLRGVSRLRNGPPSKTMHCTVWYRYLMPHQGLVSSPCASGSNLGSQWCKTIHGQCFMWNCEIGVITGVSYAGNLRFFAGSAGWIEYGSENWSCVSLASSGWFWKGKMKTRNEGVRGLEERRKERKKLCPNRQNRRIGMPAKGPALKWKLVRILTRTDQTATWSKNGKSKIVQDGRWRPPALPLCLLEKERRRMWFPRAKRKVTNELLSCYGW